MREPFSFASALKETMELCWPRSQGAEKSEQISAIDSPTRMSGGNSGTESDEEETLTPREIAENELRDTREFNRF